MPQLSQLHLIHNKYYMDVLKNFFSNLRKKTSKGHAADVLVGYTRFVWQFSLGFLGALLVTLLLYDGYIFLTHVQNADQIGGSGSGEGTVKTIDKKLFAEAKDLLEKRKARFDAAGDNLPARNPFQSIDEIKQQEAAKAIEAAAAAKLEKTKKSQ